MRKYLILICAFLLFDVAFAQIDFTDEPFDCFHVETPTGGTSKMMGSSTYGDAFTPKGDLRALIIYVKFTDESMEPTANEDYELSGWPRDAPFPEDSNGTSIVDLETGEISWAHDDIGDFDPIGSPTPNIAGNISEYYYHMSQGQFKFYVETLKDPTSQTPIFITIDPTGKNRQGVVSEVFSQVALLYPNYDWSRFDTRSGQPNYLEDTSAPCGLDPNNPCDKKIDYAFVYFRNNNKWNPHPNGTVEGDSGWPGGGSWPGGIAGIPGAPYDLGNNYEMGSTGFTVYSFNKNVNRQINVFLHEIAHTYYNSSHRVMANTVHGRYFHAGYGWGMMNGYYTMPLANAWERWYSGWIEITHDIDETTTLPTSYNLKDYMQYGETMRLKLPHTDNQFIWLENHANTTNPFYKTTSSTIVDGDGDPFPIHPAGLYGVVNNLPASRSIYGWPNFSGANSNGSKVIYGKGNFDYVFDGIAPRSYLYGDDGLEVINKGENAYNGQNEAHWFRYDYGQIHDDDEENNIHYGYDPNGDRNEGDEIRGVDGKKVFGNAFFNAVLPERKLSAFTNPPLSNFQEINDVPTLPNVPLPSVDKNTLSPIILHSLSITPTINVNGSIDVMVNYFDGVIEDDFRMTGKVYLPNNENIKLKEGKELLLNRSLSPNRIRADINGSFSDPTVFITADGGQLTLLDDSTLILDETSTMIYEEGSTLQMDSNTDLYIRNGALLCIKEGATVLLDPSARIYVQDGFLNVHPSIDISDNVLFAEDVPQNPQIVSALQYCTVNSPEYIHSIDGTTVTNCISPVVSISPTEFVKLTSEEFVEINTIFEVQEGGFFEAEILFLADNCDEEFFFGDLVDPPTFGRNTSQNKNRESTIENPFNVFVMPNPSTGSFQVSVDRELQSLQYELFDFSGNLLVKDALQNSDPFTIGNQNLAKGIYILRVISGGDSVSTKILIQ